MVLSDRLTPSTLALMLGLLCAPLAAQTQDYYSRAGDPYGMADAVNPERREVGLYQNDFQRRALRGYQDFNRRPNTRDEFSAVYGLDAFIGSRGAPRATYPNVYSDPSAQQRQAFARFGGFGKRYPGVREPSSVFARRYGLVQATGLNAPVRRALMQYAGPAGGTTLSSTPFFASPEPLDASGEQDVEGEPRTLGAWLQEAAETNQAIAQADAWDWFRAGNFRRAARGFQAARTLDPEDAESYVGELFAHVSNGNIRTAMSTLGELLRRHPNPFTIELDLRDRYASALHARQMVFQLQMFAQNAGDSPGADALHAFGLWFTGEREPAIRVVSGSAQRHPDSTFVRWVGAMKAASSTTAPAPTDP